MKNLTQGEVAKHLGYSTRAFNQIRLRGRSSTKQDRAKPIKQWVWRKYWYLDNAGLGINIKEFRGDYTPYSKNF